MRLLYNSELFLFIYSSLKRVTLPTYRRAPSPYFLQATARREPIPAPGGRRWGRQPARREVPGIEPETPAPQTDSLPHAPPGPPGGAGGNVLKHTRKHNQIQGQDETHLLKFFQRAKKASEFISVGSINLLGVTGSLRCNFCWTPLYMKLTDRSGIPATQTVLLHGPNTTTRE